MRAAHNPMFIQATILAAVTNSLPCRLPPEAAISFCPKDEKTKATIAKTIGQTTQDAIASTSAAMALPEVEDCSAWVGAAAGQVGSGGEVGVSDTTKPYPPTTDRAIPRPGLLAERIPRITIHRHFWIGIRPHHLHPVAPGVTPRAFNKSSNVTSSITEHHKMNGVGNDRRDLACELQF